MSFEAWLADCQMIFVTTLNFTETIAAAMIHGAGISVYKAKFGRGMSPQQCVDSELIYWNE